MIRRHVIVAVALLGVGGARCAPATDLGARLAAAEEMLRAGRTEAAIERLTALEGDLARDPAVLSLLGRARALNREFAAAEPLLEEAVATGGADFGTLLTLGAVLWENGRIDQAEARYRAAALESGGAPWALYPLAKLLLWRGEGESAVPLLRKVLEMEPQWVDARLDYARALEQARDLEEAKRQSEIFLDRSPDHAEALYTLATILGRLGDRAEAQRVLERFGEVTAEDQRRTLEAGRQAAALDGVRESLARGDAPAALQRLGTLPESIESLVLAARALEMAGDRAAAIGALEKAVAKDPSRADVRVELQEAYRRLGAGE